MAHTNNKWLEKFEVKKPDYDLAERSFVGMADAAFSPARYTCKGGRWVPNKLKNRLFGKKSARIMFLGDITCFEKQFEEARSGERYDFRYEFDYVRPLFAQADLVVGNLETMIFPDAPYRTEKYVSEQNFHCNAPIEFLDAVRDAGIDVVTNANNHDLDTGAIGIGETIDRIEKFGLIQTGTFNREKKRYELISVNGFQIAIVAFATEHNNKRCNLTKEGVEFLLNDYSPEKAEAILKEAQVDGAEAVFVCIHWGKENKLVNNSAQAEIAQALADMGYACIIGSHPHVLQPFQVLTAQDGRQVPVFYSMGNFLSHNVGNQKARSVIACADLTRDNGAIQVRCSYIPIFTSKSIGEKKYVVLPIPAVAVDPRNVRRKQQIADVVGDGISVTADLLFREPIERVEELPGSKKDPKPSLAKARSFPVRYDDGKFLYAAFPQQAALSGISPDCATSSYSVPATVLGVDVTRLENGAFRGNTNMKKINFSKNLTAIAEDACRDCTALEGFQLGSHIASIERNAFAGCVRLSAAVMRNRVRRIESGAFRGCTALRSVKIPAGVKFIAEDAFENCPNAVFYCEADTYAADYARKHGFPLVIMELE